MKSNEPGELNRSLKLVAKTTPFVFIAVLLSKIITYIYRLLIARGFGSEAYGLFSIAVMVSGWFIATSSWGTINGLSRYIPYYNARNENRKTKFIFEETRKLVLISGIVFAAALYYFSEIIAINLFSLPELTVLLKIFSIDIILISLANPYLAFIRGMEHIRAYSFFLNVLKNIIPLIFLSVFLVIKKDLLSIGASYVLGSLFFLVFSMVYCQKKFKKILTSSEGITHKEKKEIWGKFFSYSWPLMFLGILSTLLYWADTFVLGIYHSASIVGIYNAAIPIALLLTVAPELFLQIFLPLITREYAQKNKEVVKQLSKQVSKWIFAFNLPVVLMIIAFPGAFINVLFGSEYLLAETPLRILVIGSFISSLSLVSTNLLSAIKKSKTILSNLIIAAVINLILNFMLVPDYGMVGAALSTTLSLSALGLILMIETKYFLNFFPLRRKIVNVAISSIIPLIVTIYLRGLITPTRLTLALLLIIFAAVYFLLSFVTNALDKNDLEIIKSIKDKMFSSGNSIKATN